ncbi:hypothetical protein Golomagni_05960 [Golovinomyces magnicellulatus]|nr:hypothetical protein Golomagni_05960 [Golovinomyces magnicellulatus]
MRATTFRLASAAVEANPLRRSAMALLPPINLYRRLLRAHRKHLPAEMRLLGDEYVKAEFRAHRSVENPAHLIGFLTEWQLYAQQVEGDSWVGAKIDETKLSKLSDFARLCKYTDRYQDEQVHQLYELHQSIKNQGNDEPSET